MTSVNYSQLSGTGSSGTSEFTDNRTLAKKRLTALEWRQLSAEDEALQGCRSKVS